jgi:hypothetical protein
MSTQPEALWLADLIEAGQGDAKVVAALRRLHAENQELLEALKRAHTWLQGSEPGRAQYLGEVIAKAESKT